MPLKCDRTRSVNTAERGRPGSYLVSENACRLKRGSIQSCQMSAAYLCGVCLRVPRLCNLACTHHVGTSLSYVFRKGYVHMYCARLLNSCDHKAVPRGQARSAYKRLRQGLRGVGQLAMQAAWAAALRLRGTGAIAAAGKGGGPSPARTDVRSACGRQWGAVAGVAAPRAGVCPLSRCRAEGTMSLDLLGLLSRKRLPFSNQGL